MDRVLQRRVTLISMIAATIFSQIIGSDSYAQSARFDRDLIEKAEAIIVVRVTSMNSYWGSDSLIWTSYTFATQEKLKGSSTGSFTMELKGGEVGDVGMSSSDSPKFTKGKPYLLFLKNDETGKSVIVDSRGAVPLQRMNTRSRTLIQNLRSQIQILGKEKTNVNK